MNLRNQSLISEFKDKTSYVDILESLGYNLVRCGHYFQCNALYRGGTDIKSIAIYPNNNYFVDFVNNEKGSLERLIALTLGTNVTEVNKILASSNFQPVISNDVNSKIKSVKKYPIEILSELYNIHDFYTKQGISLETLKLFGGGLAGKGKMYGRYVFGVFDERQDNLIGFIGRHTNYDPKNVKQPKYKIIGQKTEFKWPLHLNRSYIKEAGFVILVESSFCVIKLWESGIKNVLCIFGTDVSFPLLNELLKLDPNHIVISLNNEPDNKNIGNDASTKISNKLCKYFDRKQIKICLPYKKDFGDQSIEENQKWYQELKESLNVQS